MTTVACDLDGVAYRGDQAIEGAGEALRRAVSAGCRVIFVTNNAGRTPDQIAAKITKLTGFEADPAQVITSSMAAMTMVSKVDSPVLVVGEEGISRLVEEAGMAITTEPDQARSVMVGVNRGINYQLLADAADAIRNGARFIATNLDPTFPIPGGFLPGAGSIVAAIATAAGSAPEVAGKPHAPIRKLVAARAEGEVWVVGDRLDSDIAMAQSEAGWRSVLVLTGSTAATDPTDGADYVVADLGAAVDLIVDTAPDVSGQ